MSANVIIELYYILDQKSNLLSKVGSNLINEGGFFLPNLKDWDSKTDYSLETTRSLSLDAPTRDNLLLDLWVMGGLVHEPQAIANFFPEDIMQESSVYQYIIEKGRAEGIEQGIEQGKKEATVDSILQLLDVRFDANAVLILKPALEAINDLQRLKHLLREAADTPNLEAFISDLITNGDAT